MSRVSVHFTIDDQFVDEIQDKLMKFINKHSSKSKSSFKFIPDETVIHHCFLPLEKVVEQKLSTEIYDKILNNKKICRMNICWNDNSMLLNNNRVNMLRNIKILNGSAIFIGEIKDYVLDEFNIVKELGIPYYIIN